MSDSKCNHCRLEGMRATAKKRGTTVIVEHLSHGEMRGWYSAQYADEDEPSAYFMQLTVGCAC